MESIASVGVSGGDFGNRTFLLVSKIGRAAACDLCGDFDFVVWGSMDWQVFRTSEVICERMTALITEFFKTYLEAFPNKIVFSKDSPVEMMLSPKDQDGWFEWKLIKGNLTDDDYKKIEDEFKITLPRSFVQWHQEYFFLDCDLSILRLPSSNPNLPLKDIRKNLDWLIAEQLIPQKLYPFGDEGNDGGPLVFDGRSSLRDNEFPIRFYDHEFGGALEGLSEIIFSSFGKLLECLTHYLSELKTRKDFEIIPDFFKIDPTGAGLTGVVYWSNWAEMLKANFYEFED